VRTAFKEHIFPVEVSGEELELISPMGFLEGVKQLGIDDLKELEVTYLLKVLSKSELDGAIMLEELLQIMANFGLYDEEDMEDDEEDKSDKDDSAASSPDKNEDDQSQSPKGETETEEGSPKPAKKKKGGEAIDLTKLDNESIEIMAMLMLYCIKNEITAHKVFEDVLFL